MRKRTNFEPTSALAKHLADDTKLLREKARKLKPGADLDRVLNRIRLNETTAHLSQWLTSRGLRPPRDSAYIG
jgi:hypothetical protein